MFLFFLAVYTLKAKILNINKSRNEWINKGFLNICTINILDKIVLCCGGYCVYHRLFKTSLNPIHHIPTSGFPTLVVITKTVSDIVKGPQGDPPVEKGWLQKISGQLRAQTSSECLPSDAHMVVS